jgi:hypothetical protein
MICDQLNIKDLDSRRVRCLGYIVNLAAKAFLFGEDPDAFKLTTNNARQLGHLEVLRDTWRKRGPVGKFHNTIKYIRITPQRREEFVRLLKDEIPKNIIGIFSLYYAANCAKTIGLRFFRRAANYF